MPTTWIDSNCALGMAERGHQPAHALEPEAHPEQLQREQVALGLASGSQRLQLGTRSRSSLSRSACDDVRRRLGDEAVVGELALRPLDLVLELGAPRARLRSAAPRSSSSPARISIVPPGTGTRGDGLGWPCAVPSLSDSRASRARCSAVSS